MKLNTTIDKGNTTDPRTNYLDVAKCARNVGGQFNLVLIAAKRGREIAKHNRRSSKFEHVHPGVTALLEIQDGKIGQEYLYKNI